MKDIISEIHVEGQVFSVDSVVSTKDVIPFPLQVVDMTGPIQVEKPEEHIGVSQQSPPSQVISAMSSTGIWNMVQFAQFDIEQKLKVAGQLIQNPSAFLDNPSKQFFEMASGKGEKVKGINEHRWSFRASSQKRYILSMISSYVFAVPGAKALAENILYVADELFTNALYNAPFSDKDYSLDRTTMVFLDPSLSPEMIVSHNSKYLFLGCLDRFGTFECEEFLKRTAVNSKLAASDFVKADIGGAGLGMLRVIDLAPDLFIVVEKNKRTFVGCLFPLNMSAKKVKQASRNFFVKSFENHGLESSNLILERRRSKALIKMMGKVDDNTPFRCLNLDDALEISFDMRLLLTLDGLEFGKFVGNLQKNPAVKRLSFDFVPVAHIALISSLIAANPKNIELNSVWDSLICKGCNGSQNVVLKPLDKSKAEVKREIFDCPACGQTL